MRAQLVNEKQALKEAASTNEALTSEMSMNREYQTVASKADKQRNAMAMKVKNTETALNATQLKLTAAEEELALCRERWGDAELMVDSMEERLNSSEAKRTEVLIA